MAFTLTTSHQAARNAPGAQPRLLVELETRSGRADLATEPTSWAGVTYHARIRNPPTITTVGGGLGAGIGASKTVTVELANADGYFSRQRPSWVRQQVMTLKEVFQDVNSDAVATFAFAVTGAEMSPGGGSWRVSGEDLLAPYRRKLVPRNECLITRDMYPMMGENFEALGKPIPLLFGRSFTPCYLVDQTSMDVYVACVGSATWGGTSAFCDLFDGGLSRIVSLDTATQPYSLHYNLRCGIPVTEVIVASGVPPGDAQIRYADLIMPQGSQDTTPDRVLAEVLFGHYGACVDPALVDSDALVTANNHWRTTSFFFDGGLYEQQPLDTWLARWQHDALARLTIRDKVNVLVPVSKTAQGSFHVGNILQETLSYRDLPVPEEGGGRVVIFRDRTRDAGIPSTDLDGRQVDGVSRVDITAGSAGDVEVYAPFIGRPSVAYRVATYWSAYDLYGLREYQFRSTVKAIDTEEGDLRTLTHSLAGVSNQLGIVEGISRRAGTYDITLRESSNSVFAVLSYAPDGAFRTTFQRIHYSAGSRGINNITGPLGVTITTSHRLPGTPVVVQPVVTFTPPTFYSYLVNEIGGGITTNDSTAIIRSEILDQGFGGAPETSVNLQDFLIGWDLFLYKDGT